MSGVARVNPTLIKANIALFNGSRAEARRLLAEYQAQVGTPAPDEATLVQWLTAQAQDSRDARVAGLRELLQTAPPADPYAKLASQYLADEEKAEIAANTDTIDESGQPATGKRSGILGVAWWKAAAFLFAGVIFGVVVMSVFGGGGGTAVAQEPTRSAGQVTATPPGTLAPDLSTPIPPELHQTDYLRGTLQVSRLEDNSRRVVDDRGNPLSPVTGTRFMALKLLFECGQGTCQNPPEAAMAVVLDDLSAEPRLDNARIAGETVLEPVGEGFSTNGWVVFQVPDARTVLSLGVVPFELEATLAPNETPVPLVIPLPNELVEATTAP
jgi:hypothetical protein